MFLSSRRPVAAIYDLCRVKEIRASIDPMRRGGSEL
jgi:hypothetical protein